MKTLLTSVMILVIGLLSTTKAQYYNYNYTKRYNNGYNSNQYYNSSRGNTNVNTYRNYNYGGGYNSTTNVYRNGSLSSSSNTYSNPLGGTTTIKRNYKTGRTTYKYKW